MPNVPSISALQPPSFISAVPIDAVILIIFAIIVCIDAYRSGTRRAVVFALTAPISLVVYSALLNAALIGVSMQKMAMPSVQAATAGGVFILVYLIIYRLVPPSFNNASSPLQAIVASLAASITLALLWVQTPALMALWAPSEMVQMIFGATFRLYWLAGTFLTLAFARR